jgi:hypothetical protein
MTMDAGLIDKINAALQQGYTLSTIPSVLNMYDSKEVQHALESYISFHARQIDQYTKQMIDQGYSFDQIKQVYLQKGYDPQIADASLAHVADDKHIVAYINQLLGQGYSLERIHSLLIERHFDSWKIHRIMKTFSPSHLHIPKNVALGVFGVLFIIIAVLSVFTSSNDSRLLDVDAAAIDTEVNAGEDVMFYVEAQNLGRKGTYDVIFTYSLLDSAGSLLEQRSTTKAISTSLNYVDDILVPSSLNPGKYFIEVEANYIDGIASSKFSIEIPGVVAEEDTNDQTADPEGTETNPSEPEVFIPENRELFVPEILVPEEETIEESGRRIEIPETSLSLYATGSTIEEIAEQDRNFAYYICSNLPKQQRDDCFTRAGIPTLQSLLDSGMCERIVVYFGQEICVTQASQEPLDICEDVDNSVIKAECDFLALQYDGVMEIVLSGELFEDSEYVPAPPVVYPNESEPESLNDYES